MGVEDLKKIKKLVRAKVNAAILGDSPGSYKKYREAYDNADALMREIEDEHCTHCWNRFPGGLCECVNCGTRRMASDIEKTERAT